MSSNRKEISDNVVTFHSSKDVAKKIGISPVTLKKHSLLIEKISDSAVLYQRNGKNSRIYTDLDVRFISRTLSIRDTLGVPLEKAVKTTLIEDGVLAEPNGRTPSVLHNNPDSGTPNEFYAVLNRQNAHIESLLEANHELIKTNKELSSQMKEILEKINFEKIKRLNEPKKKKWWSFK